MDEQAVRFRRGAEGRGGLRYSADLRRQAVLYAERAVARGRSRREAAADLGVSDWSLSRWMREPSTAVDPGVALVHEVTVKEPFAECMPVLVLASGVRVEGLSLSALVAVVKELT